MLRFGSADRASTPGARSGPVHEQRSAVLPPIVSVVSIDRGGDDDRPTRDAGANVQCPPMGRLLAPLSRSDETNSHRLRGEKGVDLTPATAKPDRWRLARQGTCPRFASSSRGRGDRSGSFSFWYSSRLRLPARVDSDGLSWRPLSRAG